MPSKRVRGARRPTVAFSVSWVVPPDAVSLPATNMVVQHDNHEFFLSFFEIVPPLVIGKGEAAKRKLAEMGGVDARFLTRVKISANRFQNFIDALQQNLDSYRKERSAADSDDPGLKSTDN